MCFGICAQPARSNTNITANNRPAGNTPNTAHLRTAGTVMPTTQELAPATFAIEVATHCADGNGTSAFHDSTAPPAIESYEPMQAKSAKTNH